MIEIQGLDENQMRRLIEVARPLDPDKRGVLLVRVMAGLRNGPADDPSAAEFEAVLAVAMRGLVQGQTLAQ